MGNSCCSTTVVELKPFQLLEQLPPEIIRYIVEFVDSPVVVAALVASCRYFRQALPPPLRIHIKSEYEKDPEWDCFMGAWFFVSTRDSPQALRRDADIIAGQPYRLWSWCWDKRLYLGRVRLIRPPNRGGFWIPGYDFVAFCVPQIYDWTFSQEGRSVGQPLQRAETDCGDECYYSCCQVKCSLKDPAPQSGGYISPVPVHIVQPQTDEKTADKVWMYSKEANPGDEPLPDWFILRLYILGNSFKSITI